MKWIGLMVVLVSGVASFVVRAGEVERGPGSAEELFSGERVWTVQFHFSAEAWKGLEPKGGTGNWGSIMAASQRNSARAADTTWTLAETLVKRGDRNGDGLLDRAEVRGLAGAWFDRWDYAKTGRLDAGQLRMGLDTVLDPQAMFQPGNFPISLEGPEGKRNGLASIMGIEFNTVRASLDVGDEHLADVGVRYKGNGSFVGAGKSLKRSYKVDLNDVAKGQRLAGESKLNFHNRAGDDGLMTESVAYHLYRDAGVPAPRTAWARVSVTAPPKLEGKYLGLYSIVENVDEVFARDRMGKKHGAIFKPTTQALFGDLGEEWSAYAHAYDPKTELTAAQERRVIEFAQIVTYADDPTFARRLAEFVDVDEFARFIAVTVYLSNVDSILHTGQNFYLYLHPGTNRFVFIPWDVDGSFGQIFGDQMELAKLSLDHPWAGTNRFLERVFKVEAFKAAYRARLAEFARTIFEPARFHREVDAMAKAIRPAVEAESKERLAAFDKAVADPPTKVDTGLFGSGWFADKPGKTIKRFVDARTASVVDQLAGKSKGEQTKGFSGGGAFGSRPAMGPGQTLAPLFVGKLDGDKDGRVTRAEFVGGMERLFVSWGGGERALSEAEVRAGVGQDLAPADVGLFGKASTRPATTRSVGK